MSQNIILTLEHIKSKNKNNKNLKDITSVNLSDLCLYNIELISNLQNLKILYISNNNISNLESLSTLLVIEELYLSNNNIYDFKELLYLKTNRNIKILWLFGNPIYYYNNYRYKIIFLLDHIIRLDDKLIAPEEIEYSKLIDQSLLFVIENNKNNTSNIFNSIVLLLKELDINYIKKLDNLINTNN